MVIKQPSPQRVFTPDFWTINTYTGVQKSLSSIAFFGQFATSASQISTWHLLWYIGCIHRVGFPCLQGPPPMPGRPPPVPGRPTVQRYDVDWNRPQRPLPWRSLNLGLYEIFIWYINIYIYIKICHVSPVHTNIGIYKLAGNSKLELGVFENFSGFSWLMIFQT